jgi:hypothetical protein
VIGGPNGAAVTESTNLSEADSAITAAAEKRPAGIAE